MKKLAIIAVTFVILLLVGVAVTKLTVRDLVSVDARLDRCMAYAVNQQFDNTLERMALLLGESRIARSDGNNGVEVEAFTLFRIPLGILRGQPELKLGVFCDQVGEPSATETMRPPTLTDGIEIRGLGEFNDSPAANDVKYYQSERLGISFDYPGNYRLFEGKGEGVGGAEYYVITIAPEPYISEAIARIAASEWPPSMHLSFYRESNLSVSLEQWIRTKPQSNFVPSDSAQEGILTPTAVAGIPALRYHVSGLYESDYIAFTYGEWVVLATADEMGKNTEEDFQTVLSSISFDK